MIRAYLRDHERARRSTLASEREGEREGASVAFELEHGAKEHTAESSGENYDRYCPS